ncbi:MAG TPA: heavy metal translocating P-type ATPase [Micropepsaceae bacterium]|nr:heavy metal translocating P-type ATPase [Micropepsaceae bacterium]
MSEAHSHDEVHLADQGECHDCQTPTSNQPIERRSDHRLIFKIQGMDCAEEVAILRREVGPLVGGGDRLDFDVLNGKMLVAANANAVTAEAIQDAVAKTGMRAEIVEGRRPAQADSRPQIQARLTAVSGLFVLLGVALHPWLTGHLLGAFGIAGSEAPPYVSMAAYVVAIALGGRYVVVKAWYAAQRLRPDMNLLMTVAVIGAIAIGQWLEGATVAFLFSLSLTLESWSVGRARRAIAALLELAPPTVRLIGEGRVEREVPAADVPVASRFVVKPGERIPLDGRVVAGNSAVNQAPITGESIPVGKQIGSEVFAATVNGDGALEIVSTKRADDTTLANIIKLVESAQSRRSPSEQWVEKFARVYTPAVMALAIAVALLPPLAFGAAWGDWFYRALVLLVIACPCALVISTPVSIVAALAAAARVGVLVKGGAYMELPGRLRAIAFDKTGTLSAGKPVVLAVQPVNGHSETELLARAAALEARSSHPLARAIVDYAKARGVEPIPATDVQILPGKGVSGVFDGRGFWLGSHRYLEERAQETHELHEQAAQIERDGRTVVVIGNESHVCGFIAIADAMRPEAADAVRALRRAGIEHLVMLTGDNRATAESIGRQVGIDEIKAELLPADKVAAIEALVAEHGLVAMVGDGVNDAPAMASASLGIAMGVVGSDAAIEAADIALMSDDLSKLAWLVAHSRRTLRIIRQNIGFSLAIKAAFVVLTFFGIASLWGAIAADMGASLLVVANGLRLLNAVEEKQPRTAV